MVHCKRMMLLRSGPLRKVALEIQGEHRAASSQRHFCQSHEAGHYTYSTSSGLLALLPSQLRECSSVETEIGLKQMPSPNSFLVLSRCSPVSFMRHRRSIATNFLSRSISSTVQGREAVSWCPLESCAIPHAPLTLLRTIPRSTCRIEVHA